MNLFNNKNAESPIQNIEFSGEKGKELVFLYTKPRCEEEKIARWIDECKQCDIPLKEVARTHVEGREVVVARCDKSPTEIIEKLHGHGEMFAKQEEKKAGFSPWKLRGWASIIGQPLQLFSGMLQKGTIDPATIGFASANMLANITNIVFGAEKKEDTNRLHFIKTDINRDLDEHLKDGAKPFDPKDSRSSLRGTAEEGKGSGFMEFMKANSVKIGEIGLRYFGAAILAFPLAKAGASKKPMWSGEYWKESMAHWKTGTKQLMSGELAKGYNTLANPDKFTRTAGLAYLFGKSIAFGSQIPDPYDSKQHTAMDTVRESVLFPASSLIEAVAAGCIAYNGLFKRKINWNKNFLPKSMHFGETRDYLGGIGGMLFTAGLIIRVFAPFGKRELNMNEVTAHITDTLVNTPPDKMPALLADSAATVAEHTKDKGMSFGQIFASMAHDMEQYYHVTLDAKPANDVQVAAAPSHEHKSHPVASATHPHHTEKHEDKQVPLHPEKLAKADYHDHAHGDHHPKTRVAAVNQTGRPTGHEMAVSA